MSPICQSMDAPARAASGVTLKVGIQALLNAKTLSNYRPRYISSLRQYLTLFARGREDWPLCAFSVEVIEAWFAGRNEALSSRASNMGRLSALFSFGVRRGWIERNPCDQLEPVRLDEKPVRILTMEQARATMEFAMYQRPRALAFFTLALFPGIRPEEIEEIGWNRVDLGAGIIRVDAGVAKARRQRLVHLEPNAREWLGFACELGSVLPFGRTARCRALRAAAGWLGFENGWPQDILRHTAASHLMALKRDAGLVADELGNSPSVLLRRYRQLVSAEDCLAFCNISP